MTGFWWLLLGLLGGWLIELAIDYTWWRKRHRAAEDVLARRLGEVEQMRKEVDSREARLALRERDAGERETVQSGRDADLLLQAKRVDERGEAILRTEQRLDARRAELEKQAAMLAERDRLSAERLQAARTAEARSEEAQARLDAGETEAAKREAMLASRESGIKRWEQRILIKEKELHGLEAEAARSARDAERWRRQYHGMRALIDQQYRGDQGEDDLTVIQGVSPRAEQLLRGLGVTSFVRLAETPLGELSRLVEQGGAELALSDPMSWAEQAALLVDRDFIGFESLKARLRGDVTDVGVIAAADMALESAPAPDDEPEALDSTSAGSGDAAGVLEAAAEPQLRFDTLDSSDTVAVGAEAVGAGPEPARGAAADAGVLAADAQGVDAEPSAEPVEAPAARPAAARKRARSKSAVVRGERRSPASTDRLALVEEQSDDGPTELSSDGAADAASDPAFDGASSEAAAASSEAQLSQAATPSGLEANDDPSALADDLSADAAEVSAVDADDLAESLAPDEAELVTAEHDADGAEARSGGATAADGAASLAHGDGTAALAHPQRPAAVTRGGRRRRR